MQNELPPPGTSPPKPSEEIAVEPDLDEEGLSKAGYDVILCGTGLVQSILASALARAGKSVLHCDGNDFYGEIDAVLSLDQMEDWAKERKEEAAAAAAGEDCQPTAQLAEKERCLILDPEGAYAGLVLHSTLALGLDPPQQLDVGVGVVTPVGNGTIASLPAPTSPSLAVTLDGWTLADGTSPTAHFGYRPEHDWSHPSSLAPHTLTQYFAEKHNIITKTLATIQKVMNMGRSFALDLTPGLLYATGDAVDGLIKSGVAEYCEFKSAEALYLLMEPSKKQTRGGGGATRRRGTARPNGDTEGAGQNEDGKTDGSELELSRVPCSKGDVFRTRLLSPVDKRRLMKFLQLASDYAVAVESSSSVPNGTDAVAVDGEGEGEGDSIADGASRNSSGTDETSAAPPGPVQQEDIQSLNERQLRQGRSLGRPQNKTVSTTDLEVLRDCIDRDVDFDEYLRTTHGLPDRLRMIVVHAMAMGSSAGGSDLCYSTGKAMADLCRHLLSLGRYGGTAFLVPMYGAGELSQSFCRSAAVHGATYLLRRSAKCVVVTDTSDVAEATGIVLGGYVDQNGTVADKVVKAKHVVVPSAALSSSSNREDVASRRILRRISILRGKLIVDSDGNAPEQRHIIVVPPETGALGNSNVIHGVALDESVSVAPSNIDSVGCTVLHLTTTVDCAANEEVDYSVLKKAVNSLMQTHTNDSVDELYHICFSHVDCSGSHHNAPFESNHTKALTICHRQGQSITLESAFHRAKEAFGTICPGADFLALSKEIDEMVRERVGDHGDDSDDEGVVLESAMDLIGVKAEPP